MCLLIGEVTCVCLLMAEPEVTCVLMGEVICVCLDG